MDADRNNYLAQKGQLGHGDLTQRNVPTIVAGLAGKTVITGELPATPIGSRVLIWMLMLSDLLAGAGGKFHSAVVTDDGKSFTFGSNLSVSPWLGRGCYFICAQMFM